jgi:hypothetical protein
MYNKISKEEEVWALNQPNLKRFEYFIQKVIENKEVVALYNEGWAVQGDNHNHFYFPLWPNEVFANQFATDNWSKYYATKISLKDFLDNYIPKYIEKGIKFSIFPTFSHRSMIIEGRLLKKEIEKAMNL